MKKAIIPIIVILLIMGAAYYYLVIRPKSGAKTSETAEETTPNRPTETDLAKLGYNADEIATIVSSQAYKNGTLINY